MHHALRQRVRRLEKQSGANYVQVPLPNDPGTYMRLPVTFVNFLAQKAEGDAANGPPVNLTTGAIEKSSPH